MEGGRGRPRARADRPGPRRGRRAGHRAAGRVPGRGPGHRPRRLADGRVRRQPGRPGCRLAVGDDDEAVLVFSSGTTGLPKAVRHTHRSIGLRHRALVPDPRPRSGRPVPGGHAPVAHPRPAQPAGRGLGRRHRAAAPPVRPRRGAAPHRSRADDPRDGGGTDRAGHGQPSRPRGLRPVVAALHHVGGHAGERERGRERSPSAPGCAGSRPTAPASCRSSPSIRSTTRRPGGSTRPGCRPTGVELRVADLDSGEVLPPGEIGEIQVLQPVGHGRLPARGGDRGRLRRRLVPDRRRRLARAGGMGPPHRPLEGDDQGQRLPGGAGRDRGGPARAPGGARLRGVRPGRRAGRRGAGGRRPARPGRSRSAAGELEAARGRLAGHLQAPAPRRRRRRHPPAPLGQGAAPDAAGRVDAVASASERQRADGRPALPRAAGAPRLGRPGRRPARARHGRAARRHRAGRQARGADRLSSNQASREDRNSSQVDPHPRWAGHPPPGLGRVGSWARPESRSPLLRRKVMARVWRRHPSVVRR